tara:strand:- start:459 stop:1982 length:1524 start_codon:yes stop_codon:yes gene_type:complete
MLGGGIYRLSGQNSPEFPEGALWNAENIVYERSSQEPEKMRGYTILGNTVNGVVSGLFDYAEGTEMIATSEDGGVYKRTTGNWSAVAGGAAATYDRTSGTRWSGAMYYGATTTENLLILMNGINAPQKYRTSAGTSNLGGSPPSTGKYPTAAFGRLWCATGDTLHYSAADDSEEWGTGAGSFQVDRGSGIITGLYEFMGTILIWKSNSIFRLAAGATLASASIERVSSVIGTVSQQTVQETTGSFRSGSLLFQSDEGIHEIVPGDATGGFYVRNMGEAVKPISDRRDKTNQVTNFATYNPGRGEYWWQYTLSSNTPDEGLIANVAGGGKNTAPRWTSHNLRGRTTGMMYRSAGELVQVIGDSTGTVMQMNSGDDRNGASYSGSIELPAYTQNFRSGMKKYGRVYIDAETSGTYPLSVYTTLGRSGLPAPGGNTDTVSGFGDNSGWGDGEWGQAQYGGSTLSGQWFRPSLVRRGSFMKIRVETTGADQWFKLNGVDMEYVYRRAILAA